MVLTSIRATAEERGRAFPGDGLVREALASWTHGVTIAAPPQAVWPWLAQMGAGRGGWYSWDFLDNRGHRSAEALVPRWQAIAVGDVLPAMPGATDAFVVQGLEPGRDLVLGMRVEGGLSTSWEFLLDPLPGERTRLLVRSRVSRRGWLTPIGSPSAAQRRVLRALARVPPGSVLALARGVHRVMQARQLRGIRRRAEAQRRLPAAARVASAAGAQTEAPASPRGLLRFVRAENGMNIVGQGARVMLFTAPAVAAAVAAHLRVPDTVRLPLPPGAAPVGALLVAAGVVLWLVAIVQLARGFSRGALVTTGAYAVCRNPIYASVGLLVLPGLSLATGTWAYLAAGAVLCLGVRLLVPREEQDLLRVFGDDYRRYTARVHRLVPFVRPRRGVS